VKLEGATTSGWAQQYSASAARSDFISQIDEILDQVLAGTRAYFARRGRKRATASFPLSTARTA